MNAIYQDFPVLTAIATFLLLSGIGLDRWWRERSYSVMGKTVLITGGSRGLGLVMARQLMQEGARLAICARDEAELEQARHELEQQGGQVLAIPCDVTDQVQVEQLVQQVRDRFGGIDILINNAGTDIVGPMDIMTMQDYDDTMKLHFWAPLYATYAVLPEMRERRAGRIVNLSSIGGKVIFPHMVAYCASKFALTGLSEAMRTELAREGISVTTVCPGFIRSGVLPHVIFKGQHRKEYAWFSLGDSLPLISSSAEQVARRTIAGLKRGDAEVIISWPAQIASRFHGLFPGFNTDLLAKINYLLPTSGGIGTERAFGKDSRPSWFPAWLTFLSNRASQQNNELASVNQASSAQPIEVSDRPANASIEQQPDETPDASPSVFPLLQPTEAAPEVQACFSEIQDTLGIPWVPGNWRAYARFPSVMQLFWQRLKPVTQTEAFLEDAIAITEHVYQSVNDWYQPGHSVQLEEAEQRQIQRELNAFTFGNPQLLIQQIALSKSLAGEVVGQDGQTEPRRGPNPYRHHQIQLVDEQAAQTISEDLQQAYRDIKQTMRLPIVTSDYQALARWSEFFLTAWQDIKQWRDRPEYQMLKQDIIQRAEEAADHLHPAVFIGEREVRDRLDNPNDFEQIRQAVQLFKDVLPELIVQDALFHMGLSNIEPVTTL